MKWILGPCVVVLCGTLVSGGMSGCVAPESSRSTTVVRSTDGGPLEVQPRAQSRKRSKQIQGELPIIIAKATASPTPLAKGKRVPRPRGKSGVPTGTNVPFYFSLPSTVPAGLQSISAVVKCYEVTSLSNGSTPGVGISSTPLNVFSGGTGSASPTLTPGSTTQVNLNFPTSTAGKTLVVIITGSGYDENEELVYFSGADIFVVNP